MAISGDFFEATISVSNIYDENNSFSITIPGHWSLKRGAETINELQKLFQLISQNEFELHVEEIRKRGYEIKVGDKEYKISDFDTRKEEIIEELKNVECKDLEHMVLRLELTYHEVEKILDTKHIDAKSAGYSFPPGIYETTDINLMLKSLLPADVKVNITNDDFGKKSSLTTNKTIRFTKKLLSIHFKFC